ncbi:PREDICTED: replication protein A 70 kDa DNA-binding subunit A-like isoform X1 [Nicotiana attenuata]|uniref:Replication protein A subunit n=1 Tax=Nicotiana attenuata TaxID=49451 RepID=A0A1J6IJT4_NICAT|nr:PREDICTED: replication protein A 70 kDa DNA-binding subunit A-like isoform X1 [Nicotiana attenuata]OIT05373.1 replication protein a 70 kda dna-binding subunit c [Nicotiana attenuata]
MPPINLTEGAIAILTNGEAHSEDFKPVLQITDIRLVNTQNQNNNNERYRILLSDGEFLQQGMLATQKNDLIRSQQIQKGSIIQMNQFVCNNIQNRMIIIVIELDILHETCDTIGEPKHYLPNGISPSVPRPAAPLQPSTNQSGGLSGSPQSFTAVSATSSSAPRPNMPGGMRSPESNHSIGYNTSSAGNIDSGRYSSTSAPLYPKAESGPAISRAPTNNYVRPPQPSYQQHPQSSYQQPPPLYSNRGPIAKNEAPPRIVPIAALNPYQGRWTIKARVTAKAELRHYNNQRGDGKVFSFDLIDSDGGEIRVTCFNSVADQFYGQIEPGRVYLISKGSLRPAQKAYNHLPNDHEIMLESTSVVQPCFEDDRTIPQQQFHFRPISDIEALENNSVVDVIGVVSSISPSSSIMRKNGTETQRRVLQLKDMSGKSVELTLWGNFCNAEGQTLQSMCDSGASPVLAVKAGRVNDFNGKSVSTISTSKLFTEPDFPEALKLKAWFEREGKNTPSVSLSREVSSIGRTDVRKTISQIKDERLGTSEKPDWITISATVTFIKGENFCYPACPLMIGDRQCNKKVTNNGDGKWRCDRCDQTVDECEYRYILQFQIQDHTGLTWVTAFQECGDQIMGVSAKELYFLKYEGQDDDRFTDIMRNVLFNKFIFKLKVKEEMFSDEQRVKSTVVKAEKLNFQSEIRFLLDLIDKNNGLESSTLPPKTDDTTPTSGYGNAGFGSRTIEPMNPVANYGGSNSSISRESGLQGNQQGQYGNKFTGSQFAPPGSTGMYMSCNSCGGTGHSASNCPSIMSGQGQAYGGGFGNRGTSGMSSDGASGECYKCHQFGHWARDCPGVSNAPPANNMTPASGMSSGGASGECYKCHQFGHWARDCPGVSSAPAANNMTPGRYGNPPRQRVGGF